MSNDQVSVLTIAAGPEQWKGILVSHQIQVETVGSVQDALQKIESGSYDLGIIDINLLSTRIEDLFLTLLGKDPDIPWILLTPHESIDLAIQAIRLGAHNLLVSPFHPDMLLLAVDQALEKHRYEQEIERLKMVERQAVELRRAKERLEQLNKYKSIFTLTVAHELRSPVGGVQSLVRLLGRGMAGELSPQQVEIVAQMESRLDLLLELINDLLTLADSKTIHPSSPFEEVPLCSLVQEIIDRLYPIAVSKQIWLEFVPTLQERKMMATIDGMDKILSNFIANAIKYTPTGGVVRVEMQESHDSVSIQISDTGIGIPREALPHIWEEFFRAPNARSARIPGTGLGLSIARQYLDLFGGDVEVHSIPGEGTTFFLTLPCLEGSASG